MKHLLKELRENRIQVSLDGENIKLSFEGAQPAMELIAKIKNNKAELIAYLNENNDAQRKDKQEIIGIVPASNAGYVLSSAQLRLWVLSQTPEDSVSYNLPSYVWLEGEYDLVLFRKSIEAVIERHEILRTVFRTNEQDEIRQWILSPKEFDLEIDFQDFTALANADELAIDLIREDYFVPFDLTQAPLIRMKLYHTAKGRWLFYYNMHHIISDGWSMNVLAGDTMAFYQAFLVNQIPVLPPLNIQYKDFAAWQVDQLSIGAAGNHRKYWQEKLSGDIPVLDLPSSSKRPAAKSFNGREISTFLDKDLTASIRCYVKDQEGTLFMFLLASINVLFYRYTRQEDIILATPVAGRNRTEFERQIGCYMNTLTLRNAISGDLSFNQFFLQVKKELFETYAHQDYPFDRLVEELQIERDPSRHVLFDVMLVLQNFMDAKHKTALEIEDLSEIIDHGITVAKFDAMFTFEEATDYIELKLVFNSDVYDLDTMKELLLHFKQLSANLINHANTKVAAVNYLSQEEHSKLLQDFNDTQTPFPHDITILDLFQEQVLQKPEEIVLVFGTSKWTYKELNKVSDQLAQYLTMHCAMAPGDLVGLQLNHSDWSVIVIWAVLKAGGAFVPLAPDLPSNRKAQIAKEASFKILFKAAKDNSDLAFFEGTVIVLEDVIELIREMPDIAFASNTGPQQPAYVLYTSGSTGEPKGVMVEHASLVNYLLWGRAHYIEANHLNGNFGLFTALSFDLTMTSLFLPFISGHTLHVFSQSDNIADTLMQYMSQEISMIKLTPAHVDLLKESKFENPALQLAILGGEALLLRQVEILRRINPSIKIYNEYGPTEATVGCAIYEVPNHADKILIGTPIANTQIYILDDYQNLTPMGVMGEIYIGGNGLARGYLNRQELTAEKFVDNPYRPGTVIYRTGDLGRWLPDGNLDFRGRNDNQIKLRGYRIELDEIEKAMCTLYGIDIAVVVLRTSSVDDKELIAYYSGPQAQDSAVLREGLQSQLPSYMTPNYFVYLESFPLTSNGKVDKRALQRQEAETAIESTPFIAARNENEKAVVEVWEEVLKRDRIGIYDNFFDLGGDSIKCILIASRLKRRGLQVKIADLMKTPVLSDLAALVTTISQVVKQDVVLGDVPFTPIQKHFLTTERYSNKSYYNQSIILESAIALDENFLEKSLEQLVSHHDALRMVLHYSNGKWQQEIRGLEHKSFQFDQYDLSQQADWKVEMAKYADIVQANFHLETGPLFKVVLFRLKDKDCILLVIHHLVVDGISWRILLEDLETLYKGLKAGRQIELPQKTDSYQRWAKSLYQYAESINLVKERPYWESVLAQEVAPIFKTKALSDLKNGAYQKVSFELDQKHVALLQTKTHRVYNTEINDVLLSALGVAIGQVFKIPQVVLDIEGHGREGILEALDITRTVGWFTTVFPFILETGLSDSNQQGLLIQTKESLRKLPNKGIGYGIIDQLSNGFKKSLDSSIIFNYLGDFGTTDDQSEYSFSHSEEYQGASVGVENLMLDPRLQINAILSDGVLKVDIEFNNQAFENATVQALAQAFHQALCALIEQLSQEKGTYLTPSDLTYPHLTKAELTALNVDGQVEDVYPLSPLQEGILYHWLSAKGSDAAYLTQRSYRLRMPEVSISNIQQSYNRLIDRHAILRTGFIQELDVLLQVVKKKVANSFSFEDITNQGNSDAKELIITAFKKQDLERSFSSNQDSLIRLSVIQVDPTCYEFIWTIHHILMDGWCNSILINEFYQILMSLEAGIPLALPEVAPYVAYINWLGKLDHSASKSYWKNYLSGYDSKAVLPFVKTSLNVESYAPAEHSITVEPTNYQILRELAIQYNFTENTFLQAAWGYLLSKYNNTQDVVFGSVVSGRPEEVAHVEDIVGLFINTIPVRVQYTSDMSVLELIQNQQATSISSLNHHYLSLSEIQANSELENDLIDHIYLFQNYAVNELDEAFTESEEIKEKLSVLSIDHIEQTHYDFNIMVMPHGDRLEIKFSYNQNAYPEKSILYALEHLKNVIHQFIEFPQKALSQISYLSPSDKVQLLGFNATEKEYNFDRTILSEFKEQVNLTPARIAVRYASETLTYLALDAYSNQLAHYLQTVHEIRNGDLVGLQLDRSQWMLISILGILKAGGAYVPIDVDYPADRTAFIREDSAFKVCIDESFLKTFQTQHHNYSTEWLDVPVVGSSPAYAIYTSGSTGQPKGVLNRHESLYNRLLWMREGLEIGESDVLLQKTPYTFDVSVWELLMLCVSGSELVFLSPGGHKDPNLLHHVIESQQVSVIHFVPSMLGMFLEVLNADQCKTLRHIVCSGEVLPVQMVSQIQERLPWVRIHNLYGPTEAAIDVTWAELTDLDTQSSIVSIGRPVPNTRIYIVDKDLQPQAVGVAGELLIEGLQVASGYLNRAELTAEKFIASPFQKGARVYRTGDLCKWLEDGQIAYLGRLDHQVKIRGNRIELGEIEYHLERSGYVDQAVVIVRELLSGDKTLVGYIKLREGVTEELVYENLRNNLPEYMIPSRLVSLDAFPMTSSGKVSRNQLLAQALPDSGVQHYISPSTGMEKTLWQIWSKVLEYEDFGVESNFFQIGGDSILSIRLISRINKAFGLSLKLGELYEYNTISALIKRIGGLSESSDERQELRATLEARYDALDYNRDEIEALYPMSDIQRGMVYTTLNHPRKGIYHDQFVYRIPRISNEAKLLEALEQMVLRHPTLRTSFVLDRYEEPMQVLHRMIDLKGGCVMMKDLSDLSVASQRSYIEDFISAQRGHLFDFSRAPLWQIDVFTLDEDSSIYVLQFHHAILDGWSVALFNTELFNSYQQLLSGSNLSQAGLGCSVRDVVLEERIEKQQVSLRQYWGAHLQGYRKLDLFTSDEVYETCRKDLGASLTNRLRAYTAKEHLHHRNIILGAYVYVLRELSLQEDLVLGLVSNNRPAEEDGDRVLGCFLNTLPMRIAPFGAGVQTWKSYFEAIGTLMDELKQKDRLTIYEISKLAGKEPSGENPFFDIIYNYVDFSNSYKHIESDKSSILDTEGDDIPSFEQTNTYLDINIWDNAGGNIEFRILQTRGFKIPTTISRLVSYVENVLEVFLATPNGVLDNSLILSHEDESRRYWHELMSGDLPVLNLPKQLDGLGSMKAGKLLERSLSGKMVGAIEGYTQENGGSVFEYLLGVWTVLLHRYTGQDSLLMGLKVVGSGDLVLRSNVLEGDNFKGHYQALQRGLKAGRKYDGYNLEAYALEHGHVAGLLMEMQVMDRLSDGELRYDLELGIEIGGEEGAVMLGLSYNGLAFEGAMMEGMLAHYVHLIEEILSNEETPLGALSYMGAAERSALLERFNDTSIEYPKDKTLVDLFEEQVRLTPEAVAIIYDDKTLTYEQLNAQANQFSQYLKEQFGVQNQDFVGIKLPRTEALVISILGVLKSGGSYIPLDINYPTERISYIESDSDCKCMVDESIFDRFKQNQANYSKENKYVVIDPTAIAYVIYTSGTTGEPKGVLIAHRNAVALINWAQKEFDPEIFEVVYAATSHCFDLSIFEMFFPLSIGKRVRILENALAINSIIQIEQKVLINTVPSSMRNLLENGCSLENASIINLAGEPFPVDIAQRLLQTDAEIWNLYGPSEDTTYSTGYKLSRTRKYTTSIPIGKPINNTQAYILDVYGHPVPIHIPGKIFLAGDGLANGYLNKPDKTKERFIDNPFAEGERMYDTGDWGKWLPDGNIEYLGRNDDQVKIRGYRIELGEIEHVLSQYSADLKQVVIQVVEMAGDSKLVAYYTTQNEASLDKSAMKAFLAVLLPHFMIPNYFKELEEMPLNANGKIDKKALPPIFEDDLLKNEYVQPRNEVEKEVVRIVGEALGIEVANIGIADNFFDLGLDSLMAVKVLYEINAKLGLSFRPLDLFQYPNVQSLLDNMLQEGKQEVDQVLNEPKDIDSMIDIF